MFGFYLGTSKAFRHIGGYILFHSRPPIQISQILIHLIRTRVNGKTRLVRLVHEKNTEVVTIGNPNPV